MRRLEVFTLALACLLTLTACGGGAEAPDAGRDPLPPDGGEDMTVYDCGGLSVALPTEHLDLLRVDTDFPDAEESWKPLISVYEKASYEAAMEDFGGGGGFLFGFLAMDQAAFEQHISSDGSGIEVFATDGERYYAYTSPPTCSSTARMPKASRTTRTGLCGRSSASWAPRSGRTSSPETTSSPSPFKTSWAGWTKAGAMWS